MSASFGCVAPVSEGTFTVPSYVLATLPAADSDLIVGNQSTPVSFNATGLDFGYAFGYLSYETYVIYQ